MSEEVIIVEAEEVEPIINTEYEKYEINKTMAVDLAKGLPSIIKEREMLLSQVDAILILDKDDPSTAKKAAELRKQIKSNRTQGFEKWRKTTKEVYLRAGQFIDALGKREIMINEQAEGQLEAIERHAENLERQRIEAIQVERKKLVSVYVADDFSYPDLSNMDQEVFEAYLSTKKSSFEAKIAAEKKAEEERLERERKQELFQKRREIFLPLYDFLPPMDKDEVSIQDMSEEEFQSHITQAKSNKANHEIAQEKIRLENIRLKEEADKREAEAKKQRDIQEAALAEERRKAQEEADKQRKANEALEAQLKKERDEKAAEEAKKQAEVEAERLRKEQVAKSGDKNILLDWIDISFETPKSPDGLTESGNAKVMEIVQKFDSFRSWALKQIEA
jgi:hypothetical protein